MVPWWTLVAVAIIGLFAVTFTIGLMKEVEETKVGLAKRDLIGSLLVTSRRNGIRYEIRLRDWGPEWGEDRWRWAIFDADALLTGYPDPYTIGSSATRADALLQATAEVTSLRVPADWTSPEDTMSLILAGDLFGAANA